MPLLDDAFSRLQSAASHAATSPLNGRRDPTTKQALAGNYKKAPYRWNALLLMLENVRNSVRSGESPDGKAWANRLAAHYGEVAGTVGADGDPVDVFMGLWPESSKVWIINQGHADGSFDEHKLMLGFANEQQARDAYAFSFDRDWTGLRSMHPATIAQLKWWLKHGNLSLEFTPDQLPFDGSPAMNKTLWTADAQPVAMPLQKLLYDLRTADGGGLLLDAVTMDEIMADPDHEAAPLFDALVVEVARMSTRMALIERTMEAAGGAVKPTGHQISDPIRARGVMQVAVLFTLSDGQTVTIWFHNPDTTPTKLMPLDELISWKWMLNKKDITIVVAPEKGRDLNVREVARRIMRLAERNSAAFAKANAKLVERMTAEKEIDSEIGALSARLSAVQAQVADAKLRAEHAPKPVVEVAPTREPWRIEADAFGEGKVGYIGTRSLDNASGIVSEKLGSWAFTRMGDGFQAIFPTGEGTYTGGDMSPTPDGAYASMVARGRWTMIQSEIAATARAGDPADKLAPGTFVPPAEAPVAEPVEPVKTKDEFGNITYEVTAPDGSVRKIQRLTSGESMGLPGWHDVTDPEAINTHLADTKEDAIATLALRFPAAAEPVATVVEPAAVEPPEDEVASDVEIAVAAARSGAGGITKLATSAFFEFKIEGEEVVLSDELRAQVEAALGEPLVEHVFEGFEGETALIPASMKPAIDLPDDLANLPTDPAPMDVPAPGADLPLLAPLDPEAVAVAEETIDPAGADAAVVALEIARETAANNEPINRAEGNDAQANLEAQTVEDIDRALEVLAPAPEPLTPENTPAEPAAAAPVQELIDAGYTQVQSNDYASGAMAGEGGTAYRFNIRVTDAGYRVTMNITFPGITGASKDVGTAPDAAGALALVAQEYATQVPPTVVDPVPEPTADAAPVPATADAELAADRAYVESLIDGTGDLLAADTFEKLEPLFARYEADADMSALLEQAATVYGNAAVAAAQAALATPA